MPQDARPSQRNEQTGRDFHRQAEGSMSASDAAPVAGLASSSAKADVQYSRALVINREGAAYWIPAFADMTGFYRAMRCLWPANS